MIALSDLAEVAVDDAFKASVARLFETLRTNTLTEPREVALRKFTTGYNSLLTVYQDARGAVDSARAT